MRSASGFVSFVDVTRRKYDVSNAFNEEERESGTRRYRRASPSPPRGQSIKLLLTCIFTYKPAGGIPRITVKEKRECFKECCCVVLMEINYTRSGEFYLLQKRDSKTYFAYTEGLKPKREDSWQGIASPDIQHR